MPKKSRSIILPIFLGFFFAIPLSVFHFEYRWAFNPAALIAPWLAVSGFAIGLSQTRSFPHTRKVALGFCIFQFLVSQLCWAYLDWGRGADWDGRKLEDLTFSKFPAYFLESMTWSDDEDSIETGSGPIAIPAVGTKGYALFFGNLSLWVISTILAVRYCGRKAIPVSTEKNNEGSAQTIPKKISLESGPIAESLATLNERDQDSKF
jgi:hypothetical protein